MEWQSENERGLKREIVDEMEVCSARMSHDALHSIFFHSVFAALVWDVSQYLSLSHSHVFAAHTVLTKTTKDSQIKTRLVFDISLELHTLWWISVVFGLHLLSWLQKHMCEECLIVEPRRDRLTDRFLSKCGRCTTKPGRCAEVWLLERAVSAPSTVASYGQRGVMNENVHLCRRYGIK